MTRRFRLLAPLAVLSLVLAGCGDDAGQTEDPHQHDAHLHGPNDGDLVELTDGVWFEVAVFHDEATMLLWTHTGPHAGNLKPTRMTHQPVLSFSFESSEAQVEGVRYPDGGDNAFKFVHDALGWDIPDGKLSTQIGTRTLTMPLPAHHH